MVKTTVQMKGLENMLKVTELIKDKISDLTSVWKKFIPLYIQEIGANFDSKGKLYQGTKWEKYSDKYALRKNLKLTRTDKKTGEIKAIKNIPTLVLKGDLKNAALGGPGWYQKIQPKSLEIGIKGIDYANAHQWGTKGKYKNNIPQRAFFMPANGTITATMANELLNLLLIELGQK